MFVLFQVPTLNAKYVLLRLFRDFKCCCYLAVVALLGTCSKVALDLSALSLLFHCLVDGLKVSSCVSNIVMATVEPSLGIPCNRLSGRL